MKDQIAYFKPIQEFNGCDYWIQKKEIGLILRIAHNTMRSENSNIFDTESINGFNNGCMRINFYTKNTFLCNFFDSCFKFCW